CSRSSRARPASARTRRGRRIRVRDRGGPAWGDLTMGRAAPSTSRIHLRKPDFKPTSCHSGGSANPYSRGRWPWVSATGSPRRERRRVPLAGTTAGETERSDLVMPSIVNLSWLPPIFAQASERLNLGELGGATVWLAVTGLSRSGKTVFITSLIHNLLSSAHN